jgi:hypothetical protein
MAFGWWQMSVLSALKTFIATYNGLASGALLLADHLDQNPVSYAIIPLPGAKIVEAYINGGSTREFPFAFQATFSTADEAERLENSGFYEALSDWFETQTEAGTLPTLTGSPAKTPEKIEALGWAYIYEQGESSTGVYQITCKLTYSQAAP